MLHIFPDSEEFVSDADALGNAFGTSSFIPDDMPTLETSATGSTDPRPHVASVDVDQKKSVFGRVKDDSWVKRTSNIMKK